MINNDRCLSMSVWSYPDRQFYTMGRIHIQNIGQHESQGFWVNKEFSFSRQQQLAKKSVVHALNMVRRNIPLIPVHFHYFRAPKFGVRSCTTASLCIRSRAEITLCLSLYTDGQRQNFAIFRISQNRSGRPILPWTHWKSKEVLVIYFYCLVFVVFIVFQFVQSKNCSITVTKQLCEKHSHTYLYYFQKMHPKWSLKDKSEFPSNQV